MEMWEVLPQPSCANNVKPNNNVKTIVNPIKIVDNEKEMKEFFLEGNRVPVNNFSSFPPL